MGGVEFNGLKSLERKLFSRIFSSSFSKKHIEEYKTTSYHVEKRT